MSTHRVLYSASLISIRDASPYKGHFGYDFDPLHMDYLDDKSLPMSDYRYSCISAVFLKLSIYKSVVCFVVRSRGGANESG